jgi:hypothetical protein
LRRICKVLELDISELLDDEQLGLLRGSLEDDATLSEIEELLVAEIKTFPNTEAREAAEHAVFALLEVTLGMGRGARRVLYDTLRVNATASPHWIETVVRQQLREVPREARVTAVQAALGALVDLRILRGRGPRSVVPSRILLLRYRLWIAKEKPKRRRNEPAPPSS